MSKKQYKRVLTIAGSDSGGGAGIQADIKAISACGCYASSAITALTVQNTIGVKAIHIPPTEIVAGQIDAVLSDIGTDAVKLGMLPTEEIIEAVVAQIKKYGLTNIVLDPVMVATSGDELISKAATQAIISKLMPLATIITPNIPEAEYITGEKILSEADFNRVAARFFELGAQSVLLKAGHLHSTDQLTDVLYTREGSRGFSYDFIDTPNTHGTGCTLSSAIAAHLALGYPLEESVLMAEDYIHKAILCGADYTIGRGHGPVHHFFCKKHG